jgi:RND superfamily putative drug exporter
MFSALGRFTVRRRRLVLTLTVAFLVVAGVLGSGVFGSLKGGGFDDPSSESSRAMAVLKDQYKAGDPNLVVLVTARNGAVDDPAVAGAGRELGDRLAAEPGVEQVASYWSLGNAPPLRSQDGDRALVTARLTGDDDAVATTYDRLARNYVGEQAATAHPEIDVRFGGVAAVNDDLSHTIESDLGRAERVALPVTLLLLVLVFGGLVAAGLPLFVAVIAILGTFLALNGIARVTDVSIYSVNLTTALGLGLAIDYSLFIVSRFREELGRGLDVDAAVVRTVETAGRTVAFSALTVAASLSALLVFPLYFLRSFAFAGAAVGVIAAAGSLISLPALLAVVGRRVDKLRLIGRRRPAAGASTAVAPPGPPMQGFWHRLATMVMRRPVIVGLSVIALLVVLGTPFLKVNFGLPSYIVLPKSAESRQVAQTLATEFDGNSSESFAVVVDGIGDPNGHLVDLDTFAAEVSTVPGVARVTGVTGTYAGGRLVEPRGEASRSFARPTGTWFTVTPSVPLVSDAGETMVKEIRSIDAPFHFGVDGAAAQLIDTKAAILSRLPWALGIIAGVTFVLLFLSFGSLLVPAKAIVLNLLSLTATFGAMVWIFQQGHLSSLLGITTNGQLDVTMPILMFCIAFGLSMDYEVFLLSRIKEEYDRTGDNASAVAVGLERCGRIVSAAAALLAVTFVAFGTSGVSILKLFGLGLALAVVMDATVIRGLLVPAFMRLAGEANWWAPAPLRRFQERFGFHEGESLPLAEALPLGAPVRELVIDLEARDRGDVVESTDRELEVVR